MLDGKGRCTVIERFSRRPGHLVTVGAADVENEGDDDAGAILPVSAMYKDRSTCKPIREHFQGLSGKSGTLATSERRDIRQRDLREQLHYPIIVGGMHSTLSLEYCRFRPCRPTPCSRHHYRQSQESPLAEGRVPDCWRSCGSGERPPSTAAAVAKRYQRKVGFSKTQIVLLLVTILITIAGRQQLARE
eukprot:scaffold124673_cov39-Tisochrysis_lutea.AAC.2